MSVLPFPRHHQLYITHNEHHTNYESVADYLSRDERIIITPEDKQECIRLNEIWEIQWYPETPISFYCVGAPTLEKALQTINSLDWD